MSQSCVPDHDCNSDADRCNYHRRHMQDPMPDDLLVADDPGVATDRERDPRQDVAEQLRWAGTIDI